MILGWTPYFPMNRFDESPTLNPTLYALMQSIVNFNSDEETKIRDLASASRTTIFNFNYPLSDNVSREIFEENILNHFIDRRINYDTLEMFRIKLRSKLNEIMPKYNLMFDALVGWSLFKGSTTTREYSESGSDSKDGSVNRTYGNTTDGTVNSTNTSDRRYSDTPQSALDNIRSGSYVSQYNYDTDTSGNMTNQTSNGTDNSITGESGTFSKNIIEKVTNDRENESEILMEFMSNYTNIYTKIYEELDVLFYGLV